MKESPSDVALEFLSAVQNEDYDLARELSTEETGKIINLMESLSEVSEQESTINSSEQPELVSERIEGNIAFVEFRYAGESETDVLELRKIDGKWYAHVTKESASDKELFDNETDYDSFPIPADSI
jgi:hypothetical protein